MSELEIAESKTKTDLTSTQRDTGQYPKGQVVLKDVPIVIENPKGSIRSGKTNGVSWKSQMNFTYGYIEGSVGNDGDEIDIFLGPLAGTEQNFLVYIINQIDPITNKFDEHKVMFGFNNSSEAKKAYLSCYETGWKGFGSMDQISLQGFMSWVKQKSNEVFINQLNPIKNEVVTNQKTKLIKLESEVIEGETLLNLQQQAGDLKGVKTIIISIASPGGDVSEGIKIMMWFDYLSSMGITVVTFVTANAYSIASLIMLAADHIIIAKDADVMVHNPMIPDLKLVNANELEQHVRDLRELESTMYELYEIFTDLNTEQIKELMDNETYFNAQTAIKYGFAHEVANIEKREKVMPVNKVKLINMKKTLNILNQAIAMVAGLSVVNQVYYDDQGGEIEISQQDPSCYSKGDRTSLENGQVKLQDGSVLNIKDYVIESIDKAAPVQTDTNQPVQVPQAAVEQPVPVASFNEGPAPQAPETKPTEMKTEVTKTETTKTEPVQVVAVAPVQNAVPASPGATPVVPQEAAAVVEAPAVTAPVAEDIEVVPNGAPVENPDGTVTVPLKEFQDLVAGYKSLTKTNQDLINRVSALEGSQETVNKKMQDSEKFEEIATEAISMIARSTTSSFRPAAKVNVGDAPKGSIFKQAQEKVKQAKMAQK